MLDHVSSIGELGCLSSAEPNQKLNRPTYPHHNFYFCLRKGSHADSKYGIKQYSNTRYCRLTQSTQIYNTLCSRRDCRHSTLCRHKEPSSKRQRTYSDWLHWPWRSRFWGSCENSRKASQRRCKYRSCSCKRSVQGTRRQSL